MNGSGGVGLFFHAGHGVEAGGENCLLPIGDSIADASELAGEAVSTADVVAVMARSGNELNIVAGKRLKNRRSGWN